MTTQIVDAATGPIPRQASDPLSQNPASIVHIPYSGDNGPQRIDLNISAIGNVGGYTAPAIAIARRMG
jgi:hypothetical protein